MPLSIRVELDDTISGLDWPAIFAGTFPDRAFHSLERDGDDQLLVHRCSPALATLFLSKSSERSDKVEAFVRESLPDLLKRGPDEDLDPVDEDDDDDEADEDDEDDEDEDDFEAEEEEGEVYPDDFLTYTAALLALAESSPKERVGTTTLGELTKELVALRRLMSLAEENVLDVKWDDE
ncbi:MAG: hypothetical protein HOV80_13470 [Polyangiaceae bacterium]|nr:hypothetical protein [Polyangiaceae bacterium]